MNLKFARHMVEAWAEMGYETHLLSPQEVPDSEEIQCAVLVRELVDDEVSVGLVASVATAHRAMLAGEDEACFPDGVEAKTVRDGFIIF